MCGISGFSNFNINLLDNFDVLVKMNKTLEKRGPDEEGYYKHKNVLLGHRRLTIIDPDGGKQPMTKNINGFKYTIVYNGEIYNSEELRKRLLDEGYLFNGYSDTEVILTAYICFKERCVEFLNGIFAFCIFDEERNSIFLVRDQLGVKPLFYSLKDNYLIFGSEMKTIIAHPLVSSLVDREGILDLLSIGPARSLGEGIFKDINEIPPAHYLYFSKDKIYLKEYWKLDCCIHNKGFEETRDELFYMLQDVVKKQMVSDRGLFSFLSGGIDSSAICSIAAMELKKQNRTLDTFTVDYVDYDKDFIANEFEITGDKYFVKIVDEKIKSNNRTILINNEDLFYALEESLNFSDIPSMADIDSSLYLFCKDVSKYGVVGLSGECADEIFGGYPWYMNKLDLELKDFPWNRFTQNRKQLFNSKINSLDFDSHIKNRFDETLGKVEYLDTDSEFDKTIRKMTMLNVKWFMVTLLNRKDRMSMANSLEIRVPFADKNLVNYAYNIPSHIKFYNGREKGILREACRYILPNSVIDRKKSPYPKTQSRIYRDLVCKELSNIVDDKSNPIHEIINLSEIKELILSRGESYTKPWFGQLMRGPQLMAYLIQLNMWMKKYNININF